MMQNRDSWKGGNPYNTVLLIQFCLHFRPGSTRSCSVNIIFIANTMLYNQRLSSDKSMILSAARLQ